MSLSFLEQTAVKPGTSRDYRLRVNTFWCRLHALQPRLLGLEPISTGCTALVTIHGFPLSAVGCGLCGYLGFLLRDLQLEFVGIALGRIEILSGRCQHCLIGLSAVAVVRQALLSIFHTHAGVDIRQILF